MNFDVPTRRDFLRLGGLLGAAGLLQARALSKPQPKSKTAEHCIVIWLDGGPSHLETFDPKPVAPVEVRGPLGVVKTRLPGVTLCDVMPETAKRLDRFAIVRSMTSPLGEHNFGTHYLLSGHRPSPAIENPSFASASAFLRKGKRAESTLPASIAVPSHRVGGGKFSGGSFLPADVHPFSVGGDPAKPNFRVTDLELPGGITLSRLKRRRSFLKQLDGVQKHIEQSGDSKFDQAFDLVFSKEAKAAFDLSKETRKVRDRYGRRTVGQSCLLARRLVDAGVPFVTVNQRGWDTHTELATRLRDGYVGARTPVGLAPTLDFALAALSDDLKDSGKWDSTLIVVMGEFGRTPKLNPRAGRDHWPRAFSVLLGGGPIDGGTVYGSSDATGESPKDDPVTPSDLVATILTALGVNPATKLATPGGREVRLAPEGSKVVRKLLAGQVG